ncbi:MAG TPA: penicillin-binding transpeptidase domain-containing protein [Thermoanaerobaculia bacterium]|nr:penicillin-binding transpeptidase domain-containing protein [Thermoanaerobaculia bacterium]
MTPRRIFAPLVVALVVLVILFAVVTYLPLRSARDEWRAGKLADAISDAESWSKTRMWPNQYREVLAASFMTAGREDAARPYLDAMRGHPLMFSVIPKGELANKLFARGAYQPFLDYDSAVRARSEPADVALYRAAALVATNRVDQANSALQSIDRTKVDPKKVAALQTAIAQRRSGRWPYVIDRNGKTIATYGPALVAPDFEGLVTGSGKFTIAANAQRLGTNETIETTLDADIQHAAKVALQNYRGAFVVIDPRTNELLAVVSNGSPANLALEQQYEPGSIMKVLTGLNALSNGVDIKSMFPYDCKGELMIDGRHFGDWLPYGHGVLPDLDEALAESCNVAFADIGLRVGSDRLRKFMTSAGFDGQTDLGLFKVPLGQFKGDVFNKFETAFVAIGLEHETVTALHVAMLASMMANRGVLTTPRLLRARRSVLGEVVVGPPPQAQARLAPQEVAQQMVQAMVAVVARPKGTGRRAEVEGLPIALKTGTAGEQKNGYQAVIMAFAPADSPQIAFGIIAENAGPAEFAAAHVARNFLLAIRGRLK